MVTIHTTDELLRALRENPEWKEAVRQEILTEELLALPARFDRFVEEQREHNARIDSFVTRTDQRFSRMENDISTMKDEYSIGKTARDSEGIAYDMGYKFIRTLSINDLLAMVNRSDTAGLETRDLRSFRLADLVIEAADEDGATHYIAMEVSSTADERDTHRALRNAGFLTRFTGHTAHAAIASVRNDREVQYLIDSGQVYWYELEDPGPRPE